MENPFEIVSLTAELEVYIRKINPWWVGEMQTEIPKYHRVVFNTLLRMLDSNLAKITALKGPRQVGKTVLQRQIIEELIKKRGVDRKRIFYVSFDDIPSLRRYETPILSLCYWYEHNILKEGFNSMSRKGEPAYIIFDEMQNLESWPEQLKVLVDNHDVKVLITGSSSLKIEMGRESLAGRVATISIGTLLLREIGAIRGLEDIPFYYEGNRLGEWKKKEFWVEFSEYGKRYSVFREKAFNFLSERGGYPIVHKEALTPWEEIADRLKETVIDRVIHKDLIHGERGRRRDPELLEEVYRMCCRYAGQSPSLLNFSREIKSTLNADISSQRVRYYLDFLAMSLLIQLIHPLEIRLKKRKSPNKIALCDLGLRSAWLQEEVPIDPVALNKKPHLTDLAGHLVESVLGYFLMCISNLDTAYFPERVGEGEIDFILTVGTQRIPIEVKYQRRISRNDIKHLVAFIYKPVYEAPFGILITQDYIKENLDPRIVQIPLSTFLLLK